MRSLLIKVALLIIITVSVGVSCRKVVDKETDPKREHEIIEKTIHDCIGWAQTKDINLLYSIIANDSSFLEVHPGRRVVKGFEEFKKAEEFWMHPEFKAIRYEIKDLHIVVSESKTVAWWFCILDDINEYKGKPTSWENTRWTGVLEKRNGKWVIVQQHFSYEAN